MPVAHSAELIDRVRALAAEGLNDGRVADAVGLTKDAVYKIRKNHGIPAGRPHSFTQEQIDTVRAMAAAGATDKAIGEALGVSKSGVFQARKRRGVGSIRSSKNESSGRPERDEHGTSTYRRGCRCEVCKEGNRLRASKNARERRKRLQAGVANFEHGASGYINWSCRCEVCSEAHADRCRAYQQENKEELRLRKGPWRDSNRESLRASNSKRYDGYQVRTQSKAVRSRYRWTLAELQLVERTDMTVEQIALMLGRSWAAVQKQRQLLREPAKPSGPQKPVTKHGLSGYNQGCRCSECHKGKRSYRTSLQSETREKATRHGQQWTGPELEIAGREDLTVRQAAARLGRSYASVANMRHKLKVDPKTIDLAGLVKGHEKPS
jgi:predicted transcriptional regulator